MCRVCGKYPKQAKVSINCRHIYCKICIDNYKAGVNTTKYPPAHAAIEEETGHVENSCNIPSKIADIINITGCLQKIHENIPISCSKEIVERLLRFVKSLNMRKVAGPGDFTRAIKNQYPLVDQYRYREKLHQI